MNLRELYRKAAAELQGTAERQADRIYAAWSAGSITDVEFKDAITFLLMQGTDTGRRAADVIGARAVDGGVIGLGVQVPDIERLEKAAVTVAALLDSTDDLGPRIRRLAVGETLHALQQGVVDSYAANGVTGYRRGLSATACDLCKWLAKTHLDPLGYVYPSNQPMHQHPGCTCVPIPVNQ